MGASAGGIAALTRFFQHMPSDSGLTFVIVLHLDPTKESHAPQVLAPHTRMPVAQVVDGALVQPNHVYVIVPDRSLVILQGRLHLSDLPGPRGNRRPVDAFFESLAEDQKERAIGIVFSGTGSNGTAGMRMLKAQGGMTMVQDPESAEFTGMPRSVIDVGAADYVLRPEAMPDVLLRYARHPYLTIGDRVATLESRERDELTQVLSIVHARTGYDFRSYRRPTLVRRIHRRMGLAHAFVVRDYLKLLRDDPAECEALVRDLLITVTGFFRDPEAWETLRTEVIVPLIRHRQNGESIRAWVPGCATGEEAYSLAMLLLEAVEKAEKRLDIKVFATDAVPQSLSVARVGLYPSSVLADIPADRLRRYFEPGDEVRQVKEDVRKLLVFAPQNLLQDPPFSKLDLVTCRNVLIYLEPATQRRLLALLHFALREGGHLFLGSAESVGRDDLFEPISRRWRIFRHIGGARRDLMEFPRTAGGPLMRDQEPPPEPAPGRSPQLVEVARQLLVERHVPAVLVDQKLRVLHFLGRTDRYLVQPSGAPTSDLLSMAREGLRPRLRSTVQRAMQEKRLVTNPGEVAKGGRGPDLSSVTIEAEPVPGEDRMHLLVSFHEVPAPTGPAAKARRGGGKRGEERKLEQELERELARTRDELQSTIEELQASNEELKASNEEVTSMNEELQSSNEELETSKEELQSLNEELRTVNSQLQVKVTELESATDDLANLLANTDIATLFLDTEFRIRTFTPTIHHFLNVLPADVGRPIHHFAPKFSGSELLADTKAVLKTLVPVEREVENQSGQTFLLRALPYRTRDNRIDGVVVTFVDITQRKQNERRIVELNEQLGGRLDEQMILLKMLKEVGNAANEARTVEEALTAAVRLIAEHQHWIAGQAYSATEDGDGQAAVGWYADPARDTDQLRASTMYTRMQPGTGFASAVRETAKPVWVPDVLSDPRWGRDDGGLGVRSAVFFPVLVRGHVEAVLAFYSDRTLNSSPALESVLYSVAFQMAQVIERHLVARNLALAAEEEQRHLGRELHDRLGQGLTGVAMLVRTLKGKCEQGTLPRADELKAITSGIEDAKTELRLLAKGLLPLDLKVGGLAAALEDLAIRSTSLYGIRVQSDGEPRVGLNEPEATQLFRIAQEAVRNAAEHGHAKLIKIRLGTTDGRMTMEVRDDGMGFGGDPTQVRGLGLSIMHHRAGLIGASLDIESKPGQGTVVRCLLPLPLSPPRSGS